MKSDAEEACLDIFQDFTKYEIMKESMSVQWAWKAGETISARSKKEQNMKQAIAIVGLEYPMGIPESVMQMLKDAIENNESSDDVLKRIQEL